MGHKSRKRKRKYTSGRKSYGICDRSGFKVPYRRLVKEPGTGLMVDRKWSDGIWNRVDHPLNFPADVGEAIGLKDPRPDIMDPSPNFLVDHNGNIILGGNGLPLMVQED